MIAGSLWRIANQPEQRGPSHSRARGLEKLNPERKVATARLYGRLAARPDTTTPYVS
jgi:hypothetical protein